MTKPRRSFAGAVSSIFHVVIGYVRLALVGAAVIFRIVFIAPRPVFIVDLRDGKTFLRRGKVHRRFLQSCEEIAADCAVREGTISGVRRGRGVSLAFSREVPESSHQRFRNAWSLER